MNMTFRWYGPDDPVTLDHIRQIPCMSGVVTAVYTVPVGEVWPQEDIDALKRQAEEKGLAFEVIESVPVHEDIKLGAPGCEKYIENYCENVRRLGRQGVKCICYNFMPVVRLDAKRAEKTAAGGSTALAYDDETVCSIDPVKSELSLPGWDESYTRDELRTLMERYAKVSEEDLWRNLGRFFGRGHPGLRGIRGEHGHPSRRSALAHLRSARIITGADQLPTAFCA